MKFEGLRFYPDKGNSGDSTSEEEPDEESLARGLGYLTERFGKLPLEAIQNLVIKNPNLLKAFLDGAQEAQRKNMDEEDETP